MTKNPFYNAFAAAGYIILVVLGINSMSRFAPEDNILMPMAALSLLVLSVCVMGFVFFFEPFRMYFDGKRAEALALFGKTVAIFALCSLAIFLASLALSVSM